MAEFNSDPEANFVYTVFLRSAVKQEPKNNSKQLLIKQSTKYHLLKNFIFFPPILQAADGVPVPPLLVTGPSCSGKTEVVKAVLGHRGCSYVYVNCAEVVQKRGLFEAVVDQVADGSRCAYCPVLYNLTSLLFVPLVIS